MQVQLIPTECYEVMKKAPDKDCPKCQGTGATHRDSFAGGLNCTCVIAGWRNAPELAKPLTLRIQDYERN